jgi:hypothetical protein
MIKPQAYCTRENKKVSVMGGKSNINPHRNPVIENVSEDPISIASIGTTFTTTTKHNIKNLYHQNLEKDARIKS